MKSWFKFGIFAGYCGLVYRIICPEISIKREGHLALYTLD